jgi:transcriptional regulator with XRE-family HTH domain
MNLDELLGIDLNNPSHRLARLLADQDEALVDRLVELRRASGKSQKDVADAMGISQSAVARIESGERDPRLSTLRRYAHAVGAMTIHTVEEYEHRKPNEPASHHLTPIPESVTQRQPAHLQRLLAGVQ